MAGLPPTLLIVRFRNENDGAAGGGDSKRVIPTAGCVWTGEDELLEETLVFTWSHTNSSSSTSSFESGDFEAYFLMVSMSVVMYRRLASVRDRPEEDFHASLMS
jgi:hypothetical protein